MTKMLMIALTALFVTTASADAQNQRRPPWGDVCCGGPCCVKPGR